MGVNDVTLPTQMSPEPDAMTVTAEQEQDPSASAAGVEVVIENQGIQELVTLAEEAAAAAEESQHSVSVVVERSVEEEPEERVSLVSPTRPSMKKVRGLTQQFGEPGMRVRTSRKMPEHM